MNLAWDTMPDWTDRAARRMYEGAGLAPTDVDIFNPYDGYAPMAQFFLEAFQWHGAKRGDAFAFYAGDIRVEGPHPFCSSGGNLGNGRTRTAMYTDSIEQLRGTAGARQVRVRAETALAAFTTPSSGGWIKTGAGRTEFELYNEKLTPRTAIRNKKSPTIIICTMTGNENSQFNIFDGVSYRKCAPVVTAMPQTTSIVNAKNKMSMIMEIIKASKNARAHIGKHNFKNKNRARDPIVG